MTDTLEHYCDFMLETERETATPPTHATKVDHERKN